ncbi:hypothetical protein ACFYNZ_19740 [Streptomyces kebangsaanensis]|uniref:Secreted protein n=1 Tax=Streptomyces kebangsaanensis TaxID=864058 RepID=A0ABW6KWF3_9ACTN
MRLSFKGARRLTGTLVAAAVAAGAVWAAGTHGTPPSAGPSTTVANEAPGYAVEDFNYPHADRILAEQGILLKRGDGHIVLADCVDGTNQLQVWPRSKNRVCFDVTGASGYLTMEIPAVYAIVGNDYTTKATMTVDDETTTYDIAKNLWTGVGETADPQGRRFMLVELKTSK